MVLDDFPVAMRLEIIAIERVFLGFGRRIAEVDRLPGKRADTAGNEHQPREQVAARGAVCFQRDEALLAVGQVEQDRIAVEHTHVAVNYGRHFCVRVHLQVFRRKLLALARVDRHGLIGQAQFLEEKGNLHRVGGGVVIELQHGDGAFNVLGVKRIISGGPAFCINPNLP